MADKPKGHHGYAAALRMAFRPIFGHAAEPEDTPSKVDADEAIARMKEAAHSLKRAAVEGQKIAVSMANDPLAQALRRLSGEL